MYLIYVVGLDEFEVPSLERLHGAGQFDFRALLDVDEVVHAWHYDVPELLDKARKKLAEADRKPDAIIGYWDFPSLAMLPILRREQGLRGPTLESVLRCSHKYWSRCEQSKAIPGNTPDFARVDPFEEVMKDKPPLPYPFWIKPVCAHSSMLGFMVKDENQYRHAIDTTRQNIHRLATPLNAIMEYANVPADIAQTDGYHCIAESIISEGRQCTLEGFRIGQKNHVYGAVDSLRTGPFHSSFSRYQYPSTIPEDARNRMADLADQFLSSIGFDNSPYNIEFFYEPTADRITLLEVNPRVSKSHSRLFEFVDGVANHQVAVEVGLGRTPAMPFRQGEYDWAAKFMVRKHRDAYVEFVPGRDEVSAIEYSIPGTRIELTVEPGMHLSHLLHQDSYSFEVAHVFVGACSPAEMENKFKQVEARLHFGFSGEFEQESDRHESSVGCPRSRG